MSNLSGTLKTVIMSSAAPKALVVIKAFRHLHHREMLFPVNKSELKLLFIFSVSIPSSSTSSVGQVGFFKSPLPSRHLVLRRRLLVVVAT
jgi:hypothetical protein